MYAYLRIKVSNDELSIRTKFILATICGPAVSVMRKAKISVHLGEVKKVIKSFAVEFNFSSKKEVVLADIIAKLKKAGGANYE